ncbi:MAG TPA: hypothetical protein VGJ37_00205 [Pyrinomonadaceae bacterium]|jgi:hypothetical protein
MNDDYLWDRSGEPDPEIRELEEILGTLRYQPKPLKLAPRRNYLPLLAIAATVVLALLAGGLWMQIQNRDASIPVVAASPPNPVIGQPLPVSPNLSPKRKPVVVRYDRQEGLAAKQQLMFALRLASEKLNSAYRRTQTPAQIKNQHKAG